MYVGNNMDNVSFTLLDHGVDIKIDIVSLVKSVEVKAATPLHLAIKSGSLETIRIPLDRGADTNARKLGINFLAAEFGHLEVIGIC
jgi:hypothetical protein